MQGAQQALNTIWSKNASQKAKPKTVFNLYKLFTLYTIFSTKLENTVTEGNLMKKALQRIVQDGGHSQVNWYEFRKIDFRS